MASTIMIVHCDKCGAKAVVRGVDTGPDRSGRNRRNLLTAGCGQGNVGKSVPRD